MNDADDDTIKDIDDACPLEPERYNGYQDEDGCPDIPPYSSDKDSDQDGIPDSIDQCVSAKEIYNKYQDNDGCPDYVADTKGTPDSDGVVDEEALAAPVQLNSSHRAGVATKDRLIMIAPAIGKQLRTYISTSPGLKGRPHGTQRTKLALLAWHALWPAALRRRTNDGARVSPLLCPRGRVCGRGRTCSQVPCAAWNLSPDFHRRP